MSANKNFIIDPLNTICKLALLYFLPEKTKLAINNHAIEIQQYSTYQWIGRTIYGYKRHDISELGPYLIKAMKWYIIDNEEQLDMDPTLSQSMITITKYAILGLKKLRDHTYVDDSTTDIVCQHFINLFQESLDQVFDQEKYPHSTSMNVIIEQIKNDFDPQVIIYISNCFINANDKIKSENDVLAMITSVHNILGNRDEIFLKFIKDTISKL